MRVVSLGGYSNLIFKVEPQPIIARVAGASGSVRTGSDWMARELALAEELVRLGAPVVEPSASLPSGPHFVDDFAISFWSDARVLPNPVSPSTLGHSLRELHGHLEQCKTPLPELGGIEETWIILEKPGILNGLTEQQRNVLLRTAHSAKEGLQRHSFGVRPLHGDAHYGNLWHTAEGTIWGDFEDACLGPVEWDLACMVASSRVLGSGAAAEACLDAYGASFAAPLLDDLVVIRTIQAVAWALVALPADGGGARLAARLDWLANRL